MSSIMKCAYKLMRTKKNYLEGHQVYAKGHKFLPEKFQNSLSEQASDKIKNEGMLGILTKTQTSNNNGFYETVNLPVSPLLPRLPLFPGGPKKKMVGCNIFSWNYM